MSLKEIKAVIKRQIQEIIYNLIFENHSKQVKSRSQELHLNYMFVTWYICRGNVKIIPKDSMK